MDIGGYVNKNLTRLYSYPCTSIQHPPLTPTTYLWGCCEPHFTNGRGEVMSPGHRAQGQGQHLIRPSEFTKPSSSTPLYSTLSLILSLLISIKSILNFLGLCSGVQSGGLVHQQLGSSRSTCFYGDLHNLFGGTVPFYSEPACLRVIKGRAVLFWITHEFLFISRM